jgi:prevent-host-death family protein
MKYVSSSSARNQLAKIIDMAQREPVVIQRQGRDAAILISPADYARITKNNIDDFLAFTNKIGKRAEEMGMNEDKLTEILSEDE